MTSKEPENSAELPKAADGLTEIGPDGKETNLRLHIQMVEEETPEQKAFIDAYVARRLKELGIS